VMAITDALVPVLVKVIVTGTETVVPVLPSCTATFAKVITGMEVLVAVGVMVPVAVGVFVGVRGFKVAVGEGVDEAVDVTVGVGVVVGEAVDVVVGGVPVIVEVMVGVGVRVTVPVGEGVVVCVVVAVLVARRTGISNVASGTSAASASIASGLFATHCAYSAVSILAEICGTGLDSSRK